MDRKIIIVSGKQFSGKDTVAKIFLELLPDFKRIGLGDAIKIEYGKITDKFSPWPWMPFKYLINY